MLHQLRLALFVGIATTLFAAAAFAAEPKELRTQKGKAVPMGNLASQPASCSSAPGPVPLPQLSVKPSHGVVLLQTIASDLAATDSCPARKIPTILLLYVPAPDFVGEDSLAIDFVVGRNAPPSVNFRIIVSE
jgi:hypothetical protein